MKSNLWVAAIAATALSGCAVKQRCEFLDGREVCASMSEAYQATVRGGGGRDNVLAPVEKRDPKNGADPLNIQAGRHQLAGPVFLPPKPYRYWVAPWTDANGLLHSGEQVFFTTPGRWTYGEMGKNGAAGDLISPIKPSELGFKPILRKPKEATPRASNGLGNSFLRDRDQRRGGVTLPEREISKISSVEAPGAENK